MPLSSEQARENASKRINPGRKPKAITLAKKAIVENKIATAEAAFAFHEHILFDKTQPTVLRAASATWLYENVIGKPLQMQRSASEDEYRRAQDWRAGKSPEEIAAVEEAVRIVNANRHTT